uniref:CDK2 associated cullin domain 1 n=1 Tax=Paramormyrops kingsleyae TaxID=1676925 RepID=A0A3B3RNK1_9TELE
MEESMEAESFEIADDHNHNNTWEASPSTYELPQNHHPEKTQFLSGSSVLGTQTPPEKPQAGSLSGIPIPDPADSDSDPPTAGKLPLNMNNTTSRFLMNVMTTEDYRNTYWPKLEKAIDQLLLQSPVDYIPISYEQIYSCVYKCVCQQHSEIMYNDLIRKITTYLERVSDELQVKASLRGEKRLHFYWLVETFFGGSGGADEHCGSYRVGGLFLLHDNSKVYRSHNAAALEYNGVYRRLLCCSEALTPLIIAFQGCPLENFIEKFDSALTRYMAALQSIVPIFIYMNKFYIETKLNRDLKDDLIQLFAWHVAEKHIHTLIPLLIKAHSTPFQVKPSTMASVVKGLYTLRPDWVRLAPLLFSSFIPQINPPAQECELPDYAAQDRRLQAELSLNGFARGDQSRKRAGEDLTYNGSSSPCPNSRGCR